MFFITVKEIYPESSKLDLNARAKIMVHHFNNSISYVSASDAEAQRLAKFSEWFTWCQTCRHGGHSHHMTRWFR